MKTTYKVNLNDYTVTMITDNDPFVKKMNGRELGPIGLQILESHLLENYKLLLILDKIEKDNNNNYTITFIEIPAESITE